jgi:IS30 family transposase
MGSSIDVERALELYQRGYSLDDIGMEFERSRQAIHRVLKRDDRYQPRNKVDAARRVVDDAKVLELKATGMSQRAIARQLAVSHPTVCRSLRRSEARARQTGV